MKNLRLTSTGKEGFLFRILFNGKKLNSPTPSMLYGVCFCLIFIEDYYKIKIIFSLKKCMNN